MANANLWQRAGELSRHPQQAAGARAGKQVVPNRWSDDSYLVDFIRGRTSDCHPGVGQLMNRFSTPLVAVIALGLAALFGASIVIFALNSQPPPPSVSYRFSAIDSGTAALCPGESFTYRQEMTIRDTPVQLRLVQTVWNVGDERTVIADTDPEFRNYVSPITVRATSVFVVPNLPPGEYELRETATGENWRTAAYSVLFSVRVGCP